MPQPETTVVAEPPPLSLVALLAHFRPAGVTPVDPSQFLDLIMELLMQDFLQARYQGKPTDEKLVRHLMGYERLRLRREALTSRKRKTKSADYFPEEEVKPLGTPDPAPPEVVEYINNIRRKMWGRLPEECPTPGSVTEEAAAAQPPVTEEPAPVVEAAPSAEAPATTESVSTEPAPEVSAETAVTTEDPANIPGTPEYEAKMATARARIKELEAERDRLTQEAEDRWLRIQAIEAKQNAEQQAAYDPRPFKNLRQRRRNKYDCL